MYSFRVLPGGAVERQTLVDFDYQLVESSWLAVGDPIGDGTVDIVLATGKGDRTLPGRSWVMTLQKSPAPFVYGR